MLCPSALFLNTMILFCILLNLYGAITSVIPQPGAATGMGSATNTSDLSFDWSSSCVSTSRYPDWAGDLDYQACAYSLG